MNHLREVAERLRIRGDYDNRGSDVADATACTEAADELERLTAVALASLKERRTGEEYQRELRGEIERLNKRIEELERERTERR